MNFFYQPKLSEGFHQLDWDESVHALKVLRHSIGDKISVTDGKGHLYQCQITSTTGKVCSLEILSKTKFDRPNHFIHIALSPTKSSDRTEWFVEKATEIGIQKISFLHTKHSERNKINVERMAKVAIVAMKQSGQVWLPEIEGLVPFQNILETKADQKFIAYTENKESPLLLGESKNNKSYLVLIGPEGDFSSEEIQLALKSGFHPISLGSNTLRTETAGVAACHILNLIQA